jgi:hypothetical protein
MIKGEGKGKEEWGRGRDGRRVQQQPVRSARKGRGMDRGKGKEGSVGTMVRNPYLCNDLHDSKERGLNLKLFEMTLDDTPNLPERLFDRLIPLLDSLDDGLVDGGRVRAEDLSFHLLAGDAAEEVADLVGHELVVDEKAGVGIVCTTSEGSICKKEGRKEGRKRKRKGSKQVDLR